jgi:hypothetical protein
MPKLDKKALASAEKELIDILADYGQFQNFNAHAPEKITRDIISNYLAALQSDRAGSGDAVRVKATLGDMPSYGICTADDMLRAVADAIFGDRDISLLRDIDNSRPIGHQFVPNINFNSLNRIISAFIAGSTLTTDADRPDTGEEGN